MTEFERWKDRAGFFLEAHSVLNFTATEICPVGKTHKRSILEAPDPPLMLNTLLLIDVLMWARGHEGAAAIDVNSWFRSIAYNRAWKGGKRSIHLTAGAADVTKQGWTSRRLALALHREHPLTAKLGLGLYEDLEEPENSFVHVDIRGLIGRRAPARWSGKGVEPGWWKAAA